MSRTRQDTVDIRTAVEQFLREAIERRASDVHLEPTAEGVEVRYRVDGLLETVERLDHASGQACVNRLMVLARLLTYRRDVPQEGRFSLALADRETALDLRLSVMPTTHGLRGVVRLPADLMQPQSLDALGLPGAALGTLERFIHADAGMLLVAGPAGAGKTTTIYALLQRIGEVSSGLSIISLEDPVERDIPGVTQIEVTPFGELTYQKVLRSILRQDPQVLALGEIRDSETAAIAVQAALSGHRLVATLHAGRPEGAVVRLLEMGIEPYQVASSVYGILAMRLVRRRAAAGGYRGRLPIVESAEMDSAVRRAILRQGDSEQLREAMVQQAGFASLEQVGRALVEEGVTDAAEVKRVLGTALRGEGGP